MKLGRVAGYVLLAGGLNEHYADKIIKLGADVGFTGDGNLIWAVFAPSHDVDYGALSGTYFGASAGHWSWCQHSDWRLAKIREPTTRQRPRSNRPHRHRQIKPTLWSTALFQMIGLGPCQVVISDNG